MKKELKIILIISLVIVVALFIGFILYKNVFIKTKPIVQEKSIEEIYGSKENLDTYIETLFTNLYSQCSSGEKFDLTKKEKIYFADLKDENINHIILLSLYFSNQKLTVNKIDSGATILFKKADYDLAFKTIFGKKAFENYSFKDSFEIKGGKVNLDHDVYYGEIPKNDCTAGKYKSFYKYNGEVKDNKYYLDVVLYYSHNYTGLNSILKNDLTGDAYISDTQTEPICKIEDIKNNLNKFTKYRLVFGVEDNNAIFDHIELIK